MVGKSVIKIKYKIYLFGWIWQMSHIMGKPFFLQTTEVQISLRIHAVGPAPLLFTV